MAKAFLSRYSSFIFQSVVKLNSRIRAYFNIHNPIGRNILIADTVNQHTSDLRHSTYR